MDGCDISGDSNQVSLKISANELESTTFNSPAKKRVCGLLDTNIGAEGFYNVANDAGLFDSISQVGAIIAISPDAGNAGDLVYFTKCQTAEYNLLDAKVGDLAPFKLAANGDGILVRGAVLDRGLKTASAPGTAANTGAALATQKIYACLHVLAVSGTNPTLDLVLQSDDAQGMATPTDRITFDQMTSIGAQWKELAGPITDTWWRVNCTLGGLNPNFLIAVCIGIQ